MYTNTSHKLKNIINIIEILSVIIMIIILRPNIIIHERKQGSKFSINFNTFCLNLNIKNRIKDEIKLNIINLNLLERYIETFKFKKKQQ